MTEEGFKEELAKIEAKIYDKSLGNEELFQVAADFLIGWVGKADVWELNDGVSGLRIKAGNVRQSLKPAFDLIRNLFGKYTFRLLGDEWLANAEKIGEEFPVVRAYLAEEIGRAKKLEKTDVYDPLCEATNGRLNWDDPGMDMPCVGWKGVFAPGKRAEIRGDYYGWTKGTVLEIPSQNEGSIKVLCDQNLMKCLYCVNAWTIGDPAKVLGKVFVRCNSDFVKCRTRHVDVRDSVQREILSRIRLINEPDRLAEIEPSSPDEPKRLGVYAGEVPWETVEPEILETPEGPKYIGIRMFGVYTKVIVAIKPDLPELPQGQGIKIMEILEEMVANSNGRLRITFREKADSREIDYRRGYELKLDDRQITVDLHRVLMFLGSGQDIWTLENYFVKRILPLKETLPGCYELARERLKEFGSSVFEDELLLRWKELLA